MVGLEPDRLKLLVVEQVGIVDFSDRGRPDYASDVKKERGLRSSCPFRARMLGVLTLLRRRRPLVSELYEGRQFPAAVTATSAPWPPPDDSSSSSSTGCVITTSVPCTSDPTRREPPDSVGCRGGGT
jgi:hypothetical protein